jgi:superoxide dismutase, Fe-Mn family
MSTPTFTLMPLPWPIQSLQPFLSQEAVQIHYDRHHKGYVDRMNTYAQEYPELKSKSLEDIVTTYVGPIKEQAAQVINHNFFWKVLSPNGGNPGSRTYQLIEQQFRSYDNFVLEFTQKALGLFGSGWVWLVYDNGTGYLQIVDGKDAYNPLENGYLPLLVLDVWEHAYYPDYLNDRKTYVNRFWDFVNWAYVDKIVDEQIGGDTFRVY